MSKDFSGTIQQLSLIQEEKVSELEKLQNKQQEEFVQNDLENNQLPIKFRQKIIKKDPISIQSISVHSEEESKQDNFFDIENKNNQQLDEYFCLFRNYFTNLAMNWETITENKTIKIQKTKILDNPSILLRGESLLKNVDINNLLYYIMDEQKRPQWDEILSGFKIIEKIDKNTDIIYFYVKSPNVLMIDHRSFCQIRILRYDFPEKGQITILLKSIDHQNCPPEKSKFVRAETIISGYIITQIGNDCNFKLLSQVDIKGQIPVMVVNTFSQKAPQEWIEKLIKVIKQK